MLHTLGTSRYKLVQVDALLVLGWCEVVDVSVQPARVWISIGVKVKAHTSSIVETCSLALGLVLGPRKLYSTVALLVLQFLPFWTIIWTHKGEHIDT